MTLIPSRSREPSTGSQQTGNGPSDRPSMRRLSSLASLHQLNPFGRRRSTNFTNSPSSAVSVASTPLSSDELSPLVPGSRDRGLDEPLPVPSKSPDRTVFDRRTSWLPVPQKPSTTLPRSRTLSNLPVPTSQARRPSNAECTQSGQEAPQKGLPAPSESRRNVKLYLPSAPKGILKPNRNKGLVRSDTEPLLDLNAATTPRVTAFKENLSPGQPSPTKSFLYDRKPTLSGSEALYPRASKSSPVSGSSVKAEKPGYDRRRIVEGDSLGGDRGSQAQHSAPGPQRKPGLQLKLSVENNSSKTRSFGTEIRQHQLLSPKSPPRSSHPRTPISSPSRAKRSPGHQSSAGRDGEGPVLSVDSDQTTPKANGKVDIEKVR